MSKLNRFLLGTVLSAGVAIGGSANAKDLTLCWAAWDPANALVELSKDFTAKTGINMKYEFVPWTSYADRFLNELNSKSKLCDLIIGDSQWIGGAAENGHYVKLNEFFDKNGIKMSDFIEPTSLAIRSGRRTRRTTGRCRRWATRWAGPIERTGSRSPNLQKEFKAQHGRDLAPPEDMGRVPAGGQVLPGPSRSTARRFTALTFSPSAAPRESRWA
jgi:multiple sugar transport system substrate-binding protein